MRCCLSERNSQRELPRPGRAGITARVVVSLLLFAAAGLAGLIGGVWWVVALGAGAFATLVFLAALLQQPGCEVNLVWFRVLRKKPIDCFLFGPIDRWEQRRNS